MDRNSYKKASDPFRELILKDEELGRGYSYVGKRIRNAVIGGVIQICPNCKLPTLIRDVRRWRSTGAGLICHVCAGVKPGHIVANDNYEVLKVESDYNVVLPERLKNFKKYCDNEFSKSVDADIGWITKELESEPNNTWLYVHRAGLIAKKYFGQKCHEHVWMVDLKKAIDLEPNNPMVHAWRAYLVTSKNEHVESIKRVLELDPNYETAYLYLAHAYVIDDPSKCQKILEEASKRFPDSTKVRELHERYVNKGNSEVI